MRLYLGGKVSALFEILGTGSPGDRSQGQRSVCRKSGSGIAGLRGTPHDASMVLIGIFASIVETLVHVRKLDERKKQNFLKQSVVFLASLCKSILKKFAG
jgi:hypothetical protein